MEQLKARLDAIQDSLLNHYESGSKKLSEHIEYWTLERREHVLYYYARQMGHSRVGMQPVPSLAISENKAKQAIEMQMILESFSKSPFATEEWTLQDVSREKFLAPPSGTFKKDGYSVEVKYGDDPLDYFPYTQWDHIYYQDDRDIWHKVKGEADYNGLYYRDGKTKIYFADFSKDAQQFGNKTGQWEVHCKNCNFLYAPVTSSSSPEGSARRPRDPSPGYPEPARSPGRSTPPQQKRHRPSPPLRPRRPRGRSSGRPWSPGPPKETRHASTPSPHRGGHRLRQGEPGAVPRLGRRSGRQGDGGNNPAQRPVPRSRTPSPPEAPPTPDQVGGRHISAGQRPGTRLQQLIAEAKDPPVLLLRGPPNTLKCLRYRIKKQHSHLFSSCTTTFQWVCNETNDRGGGRILLAFLDDSQRKRFLKIVKLPAGTTFSQGNLDAL